MGPRERTAQRPRTSNRDTDPSPRLQAHRAPQRARKRSGAGGVGCSEVRVMEPPLFRRQPPLVPEPGQRVRLRTRRGGRWRGSFRAVSYPYTDDGLGVVVRIAEEEEYRKAVREGHAAFGVPWPAHQIEPVSTLEGAEQDTRELPRNQRRGGGLRGFWGLLLGGRPR